MTQPITINAIHDAYRSGVLTPHKLLHRCLQHAQADDNHAWISVLSPEQLDDYLQKLDGHSPDDLPLFGIPFAIKDNIDLADLPTTAACSAYAYQPLESAFVVQQLIAAGAIPLGKTVLTQLIFRVVPVRGLRCRWRQGKWFSRWALIPRVLVAYQHHSTTCMA
jgi:allophanate hydrolase